MSEEKTAKALKGKYKVFDPRKKFASVSDQEAKRVQWSSISIELARKALDEGLPIEADPFFKGNPMLKRPSLLFRRTNEEKAEWVRCKLDILYFSEKYCEILRPDGQYGEIKLRRYQKRLLVAMSKKKKVVTLGSRQVGKTVTTAIFILWLTVFQQNMSVAMLGDKIATSVENLNKIKEILYRLPEFLKPGIVSWNVRSIVFDNASKIITGPCTKSSLVGKTLNVLFLDELAIPTAKQSKELVDFAFPTIETQENGKIFVTSTPNGDNVFKDIWLGSIYGKNDFYAVKIPWYLVPGRDLDWRDKKIRSIGIDAFNEQYNCQFLSSNRCIFSDLTLRTISTNSVSFVPLNAYDHGHDKLIQCLHRVIRMGSNNSNIEPSEFFQVQKGYSLDNFKDFPHVITVDVAEGIGQDYTVFNVFRPRYVENKNANLNARIGDLDLDDEDFYDTATDTDDVAANIDFEQVAVWHTNQNCVRTAALWLRLLLNTMFNQETTRVIVEMNKYGPELLTLLTNQALYPDLEVEQELVGFMQKGPDEKPKFGVHQTSKTKKLYVRQCKSDIETGRIKLTHSLTIDECKTFGQKPNGSYSASDGAHDDLFMTVEILAAWATPENHSFATWVEEYIVGDAEFGDDDDDDAYYDDY